MTSTPSRSLADERGSMLIEVLVSAVLVAVIGVALFGALNSAAQVSGKSKTRAGAAAVAQDDQERMRAMPVATLNNFREHRDPVVMGKIAYVVDSRAEWIADSKGTTDCTANGAAADYLKITSVVSAKNIPLKPIVVTSTVTPAPGTFTSDEGSLAVAVVGADGTGRAGVNVSINGPANDVQLTDANGCAFFGYEPVGGYNVTAAASGYVDANGNANATGTSSVGSQTVATLSLTYDQAGQATANFVTDPDDRRPRSTPSRARRASPTPASPPTAARASSPTRACRRRSPRRRRCSRSRPPTARSRATAPTTPPPPGSRPTLLRCSPASSTTPWQCPVPALNLVTQINGVNKPGMYVRVKSTTAGCTPKTYPARTSNANFRLDDPGFPFGTYSVCVDNRFQASISTARSVTSTVTLNALSATAKVFNVLTAASASACS